MHYNFVDVVCTLHGLEGSPYKLSILVIDQFRNLIFISLFPAPPQLPPSLTKRRHTFFFNSFLTMILATLQPLTFFKPQLTKLVKLGIKSV